MKSQYLRHEYTWSNHCITGNVLGWGITASSIPKEREMLRELEKIASSMEPDRNHGIFVEELIYSPVCGFVKMTAVSCDAGEDNRKNKRIFIYQPKNKKSDSPECYLTPGGLWEDKAKEGYLAPVELESMQDSPEDILIKMNVYDRLPDFFRGVFLCLLENTPLNIAAPSWREEDFAKNAKRMMYAIHNFLPEALRRKAGYLSFTETAVSNIPFYFSKNICSKHHINLDTFSKEEEEPDRDELEDYFFYHLAEYYVEKNVIYDEFMKLASDYLSKSKGRGNEAKKLEWLFYGLARQHKKDDLRKCYQMQNFPELLYWSSREKELENAAKEVSDFLHQSIWDETEKLQYIEILTEGFTKRSEQAICAELDWVLDELFQENQAEFSRQIHVLQEKNESIYAALLFRGFDKEGSYVNRIFEEETASFEQMEELIHKLSKQEIPSAMKDQMIRKGITLLNQDLFEQKGYEAFDRIMNKLKRQNQWVDILRDFVRQLEPQAEAFDDNHLKTACYVEQMLRSYVPKEVKGILLQERNRRLQEKADAEKENPPINLPIRGRKGQKKTNGVIERRNGGNAAESQADYEQEQEDKEPFWEFLLSGLSQGFLTGCIMYLSNYSLMIGHWKIALGGAGMWVLLMLNYTYLTLYKKSGYALWKSIGLCLLEGYLIQIVASLFLSQKIRLYYFIILGVLIVLVQIFNIIKRKTQLNQEEAEKE